MEQKPLSDGDLKFNPIIVKRASDDRAMSPDGHVIRGTIRDEVVPWGHITEFSEQDVFAGITQDDVNSIVGSNFHLASLFGGGNREVKSDMMEDEGNEETMQNVHNASRYIDQANYAGIKRVGMLVDKNTAESIRFKRLISANQVELTDERTGALIETVSNQEFENLIRNSNYEVV
jgi:hypothetical protein